MTLFDARRPALAGRPMLLNAPCVAPPLTLWPEPAPGPGAARLSFWLPVNSNQFSEFSAALPVDQIPNAIQDFTNDPEGFLARAVNWHGINPKPAEQPEAPSINDSLASLGLF